MTAWARRTHDRDRPLCGDGRPGTCCDHSRYGSRFLRFVLVPLHAEAYRAAYLAPTPATARNELERLHP